MDLPRDKLLVDINTTNNRGFTPEELAEQCVKKIIAVSDNAHPGVRDQARAFSKDIEKLIAHYMQQAVQSDRTEKIWMDLFLGRKIPYWTVSLFAKIRLTRSI